jgi:pimeloyl-ACP methyl ester carboxylesterase
MRGRENFTLVDVKQAGHCAQLDAPEEVRGAILAHLEGVGSRAE